VRLEEGFSWLGRNCQGDVAGQAGGLLPQFPHGRGFPELSLEHRAEGENPLPVRHLETDQASLLASQEAQADRV